MAEPDRDTKTLSAPLFFPRSSWRCSQETRRMVGLCLADLSSIAGCARASDEREEGMSRRCECL